MHLSYLGACVLPVFIANGVTSVRDAGARMDEIVPWRAQIARGELLGPRIKTAGLDIESGAWLDRAFQFAPDTLPIWYWGPRIRMNGPEDAAAVVDSLERLGVDFVKFRNLPRANFLALAAETKHRGLLLAGHAPHGTSVADGAAAGLTSFEHAETVMIALDSLREPERLRACGVLARHGTFITPTLISDVTLWLTPDSVARDSRGLKRYARHSASLRQPADTQSLEFGAGAQ